MEVHVESSGIDGDDIDDGRQGTTRTIEEREVFRKAFPAVMVDTTLGFNVLGACWQVEGTILPKSPFLSVKGNRFLCCKEALLYYKLSTLCCTIPVFPILVSLSSSSLVC